MNRLTEEWIEKAEGDYATAVRERRARRAPNFDACCFHAQQCVEKYLKARLQVADIPFARTHDLNHLLDLTLAVEPLWEAMRTDLQVLKTYAVAFRYPGESADKASAVEALKLYRRIRDQVRESLRLPSSKPPAG
jgi:HEPN domain-containing protein